ncbi:circadian clock protein KaiC [Dyadobacter fanqingshengii]|uniref:non-specific serine/threonine protein kinase n=1 Tax=Dyadobacter fanqingshengii TaxID=2906443 RepID=A0A9X1T916_9BACT|nr:circadian clock protein KaiC [Dyadobacter fanqingshengii]MCF0040143.1 circadian clock protein KaiC [Dyadobacter fanqingshengii]MCF2502368.1 circadian clock protein KaiC [Dyadobacter fanqingshengii]USJ38105.1 circadian clock protein KaiC [Dyadobacter fanqingshengii]
MNTNSSESQISLPQLQKSRTGIKGLDEITHGGFPQGRPTLICGSAGCGKTLFSIEFLVHGALDYGEPGVFVAFEEKTEELTVNVASLGFDLAQMQKDKLIKLDHVHIERSEIEETGEYDLDGLFIRLGYAIDSIGAKRVVLDTIESLFSGLDNEAIIRAELRRLFEFLKERKVTTVITGEKGDGMLTRQGLEEYVSDCVILLDHRVENKISTRLLRIVKYRGSVHGTNEYPFLIDEDGISVLPVTSLTLAHDASSERISSGIPALNKMLGGEGFFRGSSILVSGTAGTGKTSIAGSFANETCLNGERCVYFAFEESPKQIVRNMRSIGVDLQAHIDNGLLTFHASRPTLNGLEMHLLALNKMITQIKPTTVVVDPITNLITVGSVSEVKSVLIRLIDFLQSKGITVLFTALSLNDNISEQTDESISSLVDAWLLVRDIESNGERNRGLYVMKSRGMNHSNQVREFVISDHGLDLVDVFLGPDGVLTGSAREAQQLHEQTGVALRDQAVSRKDREIERKRMVLESKISSLKVEFESLQEELNKSFIDEELKKEVFEKNRQETTQIPDSGQSKE